MGHCRFADQRMSMVATYARTATCFSPSRITSLPDGDLDRGEEVKLLPRTEVGSPPSCYRISIFRSESTINKMLAGVQNTGCAGPKKKEFIRHMRKIQWLIKKWLRWTQNSSIWTLANLYLVLHSKFFRTPRERTPFEKQTQNCP
jgi:hypothetical protein